MYTLLIAGAGYTGGAIARFFNAKKQKVYALTRSAEKAASFEAEGINPLMMDLTKPETLEKLPQAHFVVIAVAPDQRTQEAYQQTYVAGVGHFLEALKRQPKPLLVVYLSSTGVWPDQAGGWVDETLPAIPDSDRGRLLLRAEEQVLNSGLPAVVLRLAGIYGPGRHRLAPRGKTDFPSQTPRWMNLIHVEDIVQAMPLIFKKAEVGTIIACVDDSPVASPEFYDWLAQNAGMAPCPESLEQPIRGKRVRNTLLKSLGFQLKYPTFRDGYRALLADGKAF